MIYAHRSVAKVYLPRCQNNQYQYVHFYSCIDKAKCILRPQMNDDLESFEPLNILFLMQWQIINFYESAEPLTDSL